jgi:hypothetical protein
MQLKPRFCRDFDRSIDHSPAPENRGVPVRVRVSPPRVPRCDFPVSAPGENWATCAG